MTRLWWKLRLVLAVCFLTVTLCSKIPASAAIVRGSDKSLKTLNDDRSLQSDSKSSPDCDRPSVSCSIPSISQSLTSNDRIIFHGTWRA